MKADRLLSALMLLQAHGRLSTRELADRLGTSRRTAHRDMEALCCAGVPLIALRGSGGGWELEKGWTTKVPALDSAELRALLMAQPSLLGDPRLAEAAERAFNKLLAAMPAGMQTDAASIRARVHIDPSGWWPSSENVSALSVLQQAIESDRQVRFTYNPRDRSPAPRTVDPLGLVCKQAVWYLVATAPAGLRTYRLSRMSDVQALASTFQRPANFNLAAYWAASAAELEQQRPPACPVIMAVSASAEASLRRWFPLAAPSDSTRPPGDVPPDWTVYSVLFENQEQARFVVLGLGARALVLSPPELAAQIENEIEQSLIRAGASRLHSVHATAT